MTTNFKKIYSEYLPTLDVTLESYEHVPTGAKHFHFASKKQENVFMVALRTMPHNSTGVAHILEHTALCGSKNFQFHDPFFGMLKRSLQTFMNAFTSSDWTAYPFATENKEDFQNLLRVYLDAVFFPNLQYEDFLQEGHRLDFDENENLTIKWVVFNEMKGVYGNPHERLYEINKSLLHPETTYHFDSGGAPAVIPKLSYEEFLTFHKKNYHPTNATFFTFGDISASEHQENFQKLVLDFFPSKWERVTTVDETRYLAPVKVETNFPSSDTENPNQTHIIFSWLLGHAHNARQHFEALVVYKYLLGHSGSPLYKALETLPFAASISPLTMFDPSGREIRIFTGIVTDDKEYADETEKIVFQALEQVAREWVPTDEAEGILDSIDMGIRQLGSDGYPYGLSLILQAIGAATHDENLKNMIDPSDILDEIRAQIHDPHYLGKIIEELFVHNQHRTRLVAVGSQEAVVEEQNREKIFLENIQKSLTDIDRKIIKENIVSLSKRQQTPQDLELLPKIRMKDISPTAKEIHTRHEKSNSHIHYSEATNTINYFYKFFPLENCSTEDLQIVQLMITIVGKLGYDGLDYVEVQKQIAKKMNFSTAFWSFCRKNENAIRSYFLMGASFLEHNTTDALNLFDKIFKNTRFDEIDQIRNIINDSLLATKNTLTSSGHQTAMERASSGHTLLAHIDEKTDNIENLYFLKKFLEKSDDEIRQIFEKYYKIITQNTPFVLSVAKDEFLPEVIDGHTFKNATSEKFTSYHTNEAWLADLSINYCALSVKTVHKDHPDAILLTLLWQFLRDGFLHSAIRERGWAYGSGANYNASSESFRFFSYRDPRIAGTFDDFEASVKWFLETEHDHGRLDEAKIWVIARMDIPKSPFQTAYADGRSYLAWYDQDDENAERKRLLNATIDDLKRVARAYLSDLSSASRVVIAGKQHRQEVENMWFDIFDLE